MEWGHLEEAAGLLNESLAVGQRIGFPRVNGVSSNTVGALISLGRYDDAEARIAETGPRGVGICGVAPQLTPAEIAILRGQLDDAAQLLAAADEASAQLFDVQTRGAFHLISAALDLERGRADDASAHVELALATTVGTDEGWFAPDMCSVGVRALADRLADAHARGRAVDVDDLSCRAAALVQKAKDIVAARDASGGLPGRVRSEPWLCASRSSHGFPSPIRRCGLRQATCGTQAVSRTRPPIVDGDRRRHC